MTEAIVLAELWRGPFLESVHLGDAVVCNAAGDIAQAWGNPDKTVLPRSSVKMIQALPLVESGAADAAGLRSDHLALACASHSGATVHSGLARDWVHGLGLSETDLRCGAHAPWDSAARKDLVCSDDSPCQFFNNCSGKHAGFLTWVQHAGAGPEYVDPDHPLQRTIKERFEDVTGQASPGFGIDGCSAPNYASTLHGIARAMARFAVDRDGAKARLVDAMAKHPLLVAGQGRACTELMLAMDGRAVVKTGAEGVYIAILPEKGLGVALKAADGATRAAECAIAAILVKLGALDPAHPAAIKRMAPVDTNWRGIETGYTRPGPALR